MSIIVAILVFGLIVFIHELGHFVVAKLSGITVHQFSIGFGPAIIKKQIGETLYAIRILPLGGAVMMKGEVDEEGLEDTKGSFLKATLFQRFCVSFAGSFMNLISAVLILLILVMPVSSIITGGLSGFMEGFEHQGEQGFLPGDEIVKINDMKIYIYNDIANALFLGKGQPYDFVVERDGKRVSIEGVDLQTKVYAEAGEMPKYGFYFESGEIGFLGKIKYAVNSAQSFLQSALKSIKMMVSGQVKADDMMGTVGIANEISDRAKQSPIELWYFVAFLSVNLAFINLLPIPGLDGGKIMFLLIELIRRKPMNPKYEGYVQMAGLVLIFGLFIVITYNDIVRLIAG